MCAALVREGMIFHSSVHTRVPREYDMRRNARKVKIVIYTRAHDRRAPVRTVLRVPGDGHTQHRTP
eukprot:3926448-Prymnesium_polylepis.1